jgi:alkanesulfonate monooxygenase SsuD/methylene tetrahydromethanopterin reductase-like flavin-dependent oxidoreductase (luciferase family)
MVGPVGYRNPALLARMISTIDHISGGGFLSGLGASGYRPDGNGHTGYRPLKRLRKWLERPH